MGLSRLSEKCRKCPFVDKCNHKQMEALAYLSKPLTEAWEQFVVTVRQPA